MVTDRYQHVRHHASVAEFVEWARGEELAVLAIEQFGSTRSINAGAAAAVTMHAWIRRHVFGQRVG